MTAEPFVIESQLQADEAPEAMPLELVEVVKAVREGDDTAFEQLMILTERRTAQIAWRILGDAEEVKDAMQETYLRVFRHFRSYDERHDVRAWIARITVNVCRDFLRRRRRGSIFQPLTLVETPESGDRSAVDELVARDEVTALKRGIDKLAPKERLALILKDIEGLHTAEVAAMLGSTVATVRVQVSRARAKLRRILGAKDE